MLFVATLGSLYYSLNNSKRKYTICGLFTVCIISVYVYVCPIVCELIVLFKYCTVFGQLISTLLTFGLV